MGQKVRGGMYCPACDRPVMGVKNTHRLRNTAAVVTAPVGVPFAKMEGYVCPNCGGPVGRLKSPTARERADAIIEQLVAAHQAAGVPRPRDPEHPRHGCPVCKNFRPPAQKIPWFIRTR